MKLVTGRLAEGVGITGAQTLDEKGDSCGGAHRHPPGHFPREHPTGLCGRQRPVRNGDHHGEGGMQGQWAHLSARSHRHQAPVHGGGGVVGMPLCGGGDAIHPLETHLTAGYLEGGGRGHPQRRNRPESSPDRDVGGDLDAVRRGGTGDTPNQCLQGVVGHPVRTDHFPAFSEVNRYPAAEGEGQRQHVEPRSQVRRRSGSGGDDHSSAPNSMNTLVAWGTIERISASMRRVMSSRSAAVLPGSTVTSRFTRISSGPRGMVSRRSTVSTSPTERTAARIAERTCRLADSPTSSPLVSMARIQAVRHSMTPITSEATPSQWGSPVHSARSRPAAATAMPITATESSKSTTSSVGSLVSRIVRHTRRLPRRRLNSLTAGRKATPNSNTAATPSTIRLKGRPPSAARGWRRRSSPSVIATTPPPTKRNTATMKAQK